MSAIAKAHAIHEKLPAKEVGPVLKKLPASLRRMGLIRTLEWLESGREAKRGVAIFEAIMPGLSLKPTISETVEHLETCPRREYFDVQRRALELVDALALIHRIHETGGRP